MKILKLLSKFLIIFLYIGFSINSATSNEPVDIWNINKKEDSVEKISIENVDNKIQENNQAIKILEIQRQGKRPQKISEFLLGSRIKKGSMISNV